MIQLLIVCPLVFLAGFVDAIAGGGGLISLPAYFIAGVPIHQSIATNKLSSAMGTVVSTTKFAKNGYIKLRLSIPCGIAALISAPLGALIALRIQEKTIEALMLIILPVTAFYVLKNKTLGAKDNSKITTKSYIVSIFCAFFVGMYDGFYGPGTGTFLILLLTGMAKLDLNTSAGTTKVINLSSNIASLITFIVTGNVIYTIGLIAGIFSILGHYTGSRCFVANGTKIVRPIILFVLTILFIKILIK